MDKETELKVIGLCIILYLTVAYLMAVPHGAVYHPPGVALDVLISPSNFNGTIIQHHASGVYIDVDGTLRGI